MLSEVERNISLDSLSNAQTKNLQTLLGSIGLYKGRVDGILGPKTKAAWKEYRTKHSYGDPDIISPESVEVLKLLAAKAEEDKVKPIDSKYDMTTKDGTIAAIIDECDKYGLSLPTQKAYVLATVEWETGHTFMPVREAPNLSESWRKRNLRYWPYYGRGYVQITWKTNYQKFSKLLGVDLVKNPDLTMEPNIALFILLYGFKNGSFTGRKLEHYVNVNKTDFIGARDCINGRRDQASMIAKMARNWLAKL